MKKLHITGIMVYAIDNGRSRKTDLEKVDDIVAIGDLPQYRKDKTKWVQKKYGKKHTIDLIYGKLRST